MHCHHRASCLNKSREAMLSRKQHEGPRLATNPVLLPNVPMPQTICMNNEGAQLIFASVNGAGKERRRAAMWVAL